jgi:hypothetical protein
MSRLLCVDDNQLHYIAEAIRFAQLHDEFNPSVLTDEDEYSLDDTLLDSICDALDQPDNTDIINNLTL